MGQSIGELFVKLGFDVDDTKLKSFDESIQSVYSGLLKFAGAAGLATGFYEIAKHAENNAISIEKMTAAYGVSAKAIQDWGAIIHETWPDTSYAQGIQQFGKVAEYLKNTAFTPQGAMALNRLGVQYSAADLQHPEKILDKLFDTIPKLLAAHPSYRGLYSGFVGQLTGDPANIAIFERGRQAANLAASHTGLYQKELDDTVTAARKVAELQDRWDKFINHAIASIAGSFESKGFLGGIKDIATNVGKNSWIDSLGAWDPFGLGNIGPAVKGLMSNENVHGMIRKLGWSGNQASGMVRRLMIESGLNPAAIGDNGQAYGIAQWHPDRQREFARVMGHDIHGSSTEEQLAFMNYELTKGNERSAGAKLRSTKTAEDAYAAFTNNYERPAITVHVTQNIHSNDPDAAGRAAAQAIQDTITTAKLNRMQEPY